MYLVLSSSKKKKREKGTEAEVIFDCLVYLNALLFGTHIATFCYFGFAYSTFIILLAAWYLLAINSCRIPNFSIIFVSFVAINFRKLPFLCKGLSSQVGVDVNPVDCSHTQGNLCPDVSSLSPLLCPHFNQAQARPDLETPRG